MAKKWVATWDFQQFGMCDQQRLRSACAYIPSDQSFCWSFGYSMTVELLTEHHLEFLSLKESSTGSSEPTLVKMPHCWKSHAAALNATIIDRLTAPWGRDTGCRYLNNSKMAITYIVKEQILYFPEGDCKTRKGTANYITNKDHSHFPPHTMVS